MVEVVIYVLGGLAGLSIITIGVVACVVYHGDGQAMRQTVAKLGEDEFAIRLSTVIIIVFSTALLALTNILNGDVAGAIFSGVAGYVLGGVRKQKNLHETVK